MALKRPQDELPSAKLKSIKLETVLHDPCNDEAGKKSLNDLKKEIYSLLSLFPENCGDFATGSVLSDLELHCFPHIEIQDYGILPLPINKLVFDSIKPICLQSPYGLGEETLVDVAVRNSFQLDPQQFVIKNKEFDNQIAALIEDKIKPNLGLKGTTIFGRIYKLLIYEPGGKFAEHRDTEKHQGMFGTLIIQLPSVFTGGDLIVKHCKSSKVFHNSAPEKSSLCSFVAHYASCPHELKEVTSGYRAALVYSLCWEGNGIKSSPYNASTNAVRLCNLLNEFMDKTDMFQWALDYEYSLSSIREGTVDFFKGCDKNIVSAVRNALQYDIMQCGKDRWEFFVARADKKVNEFGDCTREYGGYYGHRGGSEECFSKDWDEIDSIKLSNFIPLTPNTSKNDSLAFDFDPEEAVNGDDGYEFWGEDKGTGCSGPTGNEGASCERWYQRKVAVLWRADKSLFIKIRSSLSNGIFYVMSLLKKGDLVEGMQGFQILWKSYQNKVSTNHKNVSSLLEMCVILKLKEEACQLIKTMCEFGIPTDDSSNIVALAACQFKEDKNILDAIKDLLRKSSKDQIKCILQCCSKIDWLTPTEVIDLTTDFILKNEINLGYNRRYSFHNRNEKRSIYLHVIEYMFKHETFRLGSIKKLVLLIDSLVDIESVICFLVECDKNNVMIDHFLPRFASIASDALSSKTTDKYGHGWNSLLQPYLSVVTNRHEPEKSVTNVFNTFLSAFAKRSSLGKPLVTLVDSINNLPKNFQDLLKLLTQQILPIFPDKENIPDCLLNASKIRFDYLEGVIGKGVPQFSWHQPKAVVPGHPQVEKFLRGPAESFTYRNFNNLKHARNWANKHSRDTGCFMILTPIGRGSSAGVEVVKTRQCHQREVEIFEEDKVEYTKLLSFLPEKTNVLKQQVQIKQPTVEVIVLD